MLSYIKRGLKNRFRVFNRKYGYYLHEKIVTFFFGNIDNLISFNIDPEVCEKLNSKIKQMKKIKFSNYNSQKNFKNFEKLDKKVWIYNKRDKFVYDQFDNTQEWFDIEDDEYIRNFTKSLFPLIKEYLKSHFSIVNIRVWNNLPNGKVVVGRDNLKRGSYRVHKDGFPPGHIKLMIYLNPLDEDHGYFVVEENKSLPTDFPKVNIPIDDVKALIKEKNFNIIKNKNPGLGIAFKNSDLWHKAVPGISKNRRVIELTILRTMKKVDELKYFYPSTPDTMYLIGPLQAYI
tara:strand:- start:50 stop:913 length:864 start_codon:yes stop_codon:yes gene_type:complete